MFVDFLRICGENSSFTRITVTLHKDNYIFVISLSLLHRTKNVSDKSRRVNQNTHFVFINFLSKISDTLWDNMSVEPDKTQTTVWGMCIARSIPHPTNTYSEYVIRIAFSLRQYLHERAPMLRCTYREWLLNKMFLLWVKFHSLINLTL